MKKPIIISNHIKTPDGTILISRHVHDYVEYIDKITKSKYIIDGGSEYLRRGYEKEDFEELSVYSNDNFELIRNTMEWGSKSTYPKAIKWNTLKCMSNKHIEAILNNSLQISQIYKIFFKKELKYRIKNNIIIL